MPRLFAVMPFGTRDGPHGPFNFDLVYDQIREGASRAGWTVQRADDVVTPGLITEQVFREIIAADLLVAEVSTHNPNVYYELGVRHSLAGGGTLLIAQQGTDLPFDVAGHRALLYERGEAGVSTLAPRLELALRTYEADGANFYDNPMARVLERQALASDPMPAHSRRTYMRDSRELTRQNSFSVFGRGLGRGQTSRQLRWSRLPSG